MKKKHINKKTQTRVHAFRCTDEIWSQLKALAKECGISLNRYLTETGLKHHNQDTMFYIVKFFEYYLILLV